MFKRLLNKIVQVLKPKKPADTVVPVVELPVQALPPALVQQEDVPVELAPPESIIESDTHFIEFIGIVTAVKPVSEPVRRKVPHKISHTPTIIGHKHK